MRGQSGIGTIIVLIAIVLAAVVVAVVILQVTDSLRGQAMLTERQARDTMSARFVIERIEGLAYKGEGGDYKLYYLILRVKTGVGTESLDLKRAVLSYSSPGYTMPGARYEPLSKILGPAEHNIKVIRDAKNKKYLPEANIDALGSIKSACDAELYNIMKGLGVYRYTLVVPYISPLKGAPEDPSPSSVVASRDPARFTVVWENCDQKDDIYALSDGQTAYVIYPLPEPVPSSTYITVDLYVTDGWSNPMRIRVPAGLDRGHVLIYPSP